MPLGPLHTLIPGDLLRTARIRRHTIRGREHSGSIILSGGIRKWARENGMPLVWMNDEWNTAVLDSVR